jgi:hypothetical protein
LKYTLSVYQLILKPSDAIIRLKIIKYKKQIQINFTESINFYSLKRVSKFIVNRNNSVIKLIRIKLMDHIAENYFSYLEL